VPPRRCSSRASTAAAPAAPRTARPARPARGATASRSAWGWTLRRVRTATLPSPRSRLDYMTSYYYTSHSRHTSLYVTTH
jgi:hypothetical protein